MPIGLPPVGGSATVGPKRAVGGHRHVVLQDHRRGRSVARSVGAQDEKPAAPARRLVFERQRSAAALGVAAGANRGSQTVVPASAVYRFVVPVR